MVVVAYVGGGSHDSLRLLVEMWRCSVGDGGSGEDDVDGGVIVVVWMWWPTQVAGTWPERRRKKGESEDISRNNIPIIKVNNWEELAGELML
ncbi:hypothetical protein Tco_0344834 [Tanacetum coccineum]